MYNIFMKKLIKPVGQPPKGVGPKSTTFILYKKDRQHIKYICKKTNEKQSDLTRRLIKEEYNKLKK